MLGALAPSVLRHFMTFGILSVESIPDRKGDDQEAHLARASNDCEKVVPHAPSP